MGAGATDPSRAPRSRRWASVVQDRQVELGEAGRVGEEVDLDDLPTLDREAPDWREREGLGGGKANPDNDVLEEANERVGTFVMGRRMFDEGEVGWPDPPPFRAPVFVLTNNSREPWSGREVRPSRSSRTGSERACTPR